MIIKFTTLCIIVAFLLCGMGCLLRPSFKTVDITLQEKRYLYRLYEGNSRKEKYGLWDFYITGTDGRPENERQEVFQMAVAAGTTVTITGIRSEDMLYDFGYSTMFGILQKNEKQYLFQGKITKAELRCLNDALGIKKSTE